jgi:tetratricopeptide (TPR) repeat protein
MRMVLKYYTTSGVKGSRLASEGKNRIITAWGSIALGVCLLLGCAQRQPVADLYLDAVALRELGQNELAIGKLNAVVTADPSFALAYSELGRAYRALGDLEKALAAFQQATILNSWSFQDHMDLARTCEELGQCPQAAGAYVRAAELDPNSFDAMKGAAECYLRIGESTKSLAYGELAEKTGQRPREALSLLARAYESQKDYGQVVQVYRRLLMREGDDPNVLLSLGVAYVKAGQYDRARAVLTSVLQRRPDDGTALRQLGYCLIQLGDIDQAMQVYQESIGLDANDWEAHRGLGVACMIKARQTEDSRLQARALHHWRRALAIKPDQPKREILERLIREHSQLQNPLQGLNY